MTHEEFLAKEERRAHGRASRIFRVLFWVHQVLFGLPSALLAFEVFTGGTTLGLIHVIGLFLAWIGGTLLWGLASLLHHPLFDTRQSRS
jgi:uncharacterized membrane protein (DUF485 family)